MRGGTGSSHSSQPWISILALCRPFLSTQICRGSLSSAMCRESWRSMPNSHHWREAASEGLEFRCQFTPQEHRGSLRTAIQGWQHWQQESSRQFSRCEENVRMVVEPGKTYIRTLRTIGPVHDALALQIRLNAALSATALHPPGLPACAIVLIRKLRSSL